MSYPAALTHYTASTAVTYTADKATITFDVTNFPAAVFTVPKGMHIMSKSVPVGGSKFAVQVYPSGDSMAAENKVSVYVSNQSVHKVSINFSTTVGAKKVAVSGSDVGERCGKGWSDFVDRKDVGWNLSVVIDITLLKEEGILGKNDLKETVKETVKVVETLSVNHANWVKNSLQQEIEKSQENMKRRFEEGEAKMDNKMAKLEATLKAAIARSREPIKIPECPVCFEELRPPLRIVQCLKGHKICEPCSEKEEVVSCPTNCKAGFMGRDHGMEAFVKQLLGDQE